jgi:amidase
LKKYLAGANPQSGVKTLQDVIEFNERHRNQEMPYFGQESFIQAQAKGSLTSPAYLKALAKCRRLSRTLGIDTVMTKHKLDALVAPTGNPAWPTDLVNGDHFTGSSSTPAAVAGYPSISVPMGFAFGLPVNLSFFGRAWSEPLLIRVAHAFEQVSRHRKPPRFLSSAPLAPA